MLGGNKKPYTGSLYSWSDLPFRLLRGTAGVIFLPLSPLLLFLQILNALGGNKKSYAGSPESLSYLLLSLPCGSNYGHKITDFVFLGYI